MRIALDTGGLDTLPAGAGQYRYVIALVRGLSELRPPCRFTFFGTRPEPPIELRDVFEGGGRWEYRPFPRCSGRGSFYRDLVRFSVALWRERVDICHSLHTFLPLFPPCPVVATLYDLMYELFPEYAAAVRSRPYRITRWLLRHRARRIVCISEATAADAHRLWGIHRSRLDVVPLASSLAAYEPRGNAGPAEPAVLPELGGGGALLVSPYNLEPRKNLIALLEAVARLRPAHPGLKLALCGRAAVTQEREAEFLRHVAHLGIAEQVVRTGYLSDDDLARLYRRATVFVFPSLYEGFGLPVLEAMAAGACVVVRDASAMAEVVGAAGVRVETKGPEQLAGALAGLLASPARRAALGRAAAARAAQFTVARMAERTFETYVGSLRASGRGIAGGDDMASRSLQPTSGAQVCMETGEGQSY